MQLRGTAVSALLLATAKLAWARSVDTRQSGAVDPGVDPNCVTYDTAADGSSSCAYFEQYWGISSQDFIRWNPSVKADCSGIKIGHSYCVDVKLTYPSSDQPPTGTTPSSGVQTPEGIQPGMVNNCNAFYKVSRGDTCQAIVDKFGNFTLDDFTKWNAGVGGPSCRNLWADVYVCVGTAANGAAPPPPAQSPGPSGCEASHPTPTQPGSVCQCKNWYLPGNNEFCGDIETKFHITAAQFNAWNPRVGNGCEDLWKGYYVCVRA